MYIYINNLISQCKTDDIQLVYLDFVESYIPGLVVKLLLVGKMLVDFGGFRIPNGWTREEEEEEEEGFFLAILPMQRN